jgi:ABC-type phosphate/phosphonate transport system ATPase subunit
LDIEALRAAVVKKHNVMLGKDDPILITVHLNELLLAEVLANMKSIATESRNESIAAVAHQVDVAKTAAAKLITQTAGYVAGEVERQVKAALDESIAVADRSIRLSRRASMLAIGGAAVSLVIGGAAIGILVAVFLKH